MAGRKASSLQHGQKTANMVYGDLLNVTLLIPEEVKWGGTVAAVGGFGQLVDRFQKESREVSLIVWLSRCIANC